MDKDEAEYLARKIQATDTGFASMKLKSASVSISVHRHKENRDENIGLVSYYHRNPFIHYPMNFIIWLRGLKRKHGNSFSESR
jgi:hypothetical protein